MGKRKDRRLAIRAGALALWNAEVARGRNMSADYWMICERQAALVLDAAAPDIYAHGYMDGHVCTLGKHPKKPHACGVPSKYRAEVTR